ncbi:VOC family protein [Nonomuraea mesophila]|nr:VOC family protein [Nonomuraea mesophila]
MGDASTTHVEDDMARDLFAGIPVTDYAAALPWYERLFGGPPAFLPNDVEAVWELAANRYVYIVQDPARAGNALVMSFVDDLDQRVAEIARRGIEPAGRETYDGGVTKVTYRDAEGNEISFGGGL